LHNTKNSLWTEIEGVKRGGGMILRAVGATFSYIKELQMRRILLPLVLAIVLVNSQSMYARSEGGGQLYTANKKDPGAEVNLSKVLSKEYPTVLFIHSNYCGPCKVMYPHIKRLAQTKKDIKIVDVLLDKKGDGGIGWNSAAAKQFDVHSVPYYIIYNQDGTVAARDKRAADQVISWINELNL
jgi:thiol-disulfide isomerase/thioredoxin